MQGVSGAEGAPERQRPITVLVVDRDESVRGHLAVLLAQIPDLTVAGSVSDRAAALSVVAGNRVEVAVVDARVVGASGRVLCNDIRLRSPTTRCILHVTTDLDPEAREAPGVDAIVAKQLVASDLVATIRVLAMKRP